MQKLGHALLHRLTGPQTHTRIHKHTFFKVRATMPGATLTSMTIRALTTT